MSNNVTNIVRFRGDESRIEELRTAVQDDRYGKIGIAFEKIIPMPENLFMGAVGIREHELYGTNNWLDWSLANWGSKWNSMPTEDPDEVYVPDTLRFLTANNPPHPVLQKLSEMYPDITMEHQWTDYNIGYGCGQRTYKAGNIIDEYCPDYGRRAIEFSCEVIGQTPADRGLVLSDDGTDYVSMELMEGGIQL